MKKLLVLAVSIAVAGFVVVSEVRAEDGGELEISGNITTVSGWQHSRNGARQNPARGGLLGDGLRTMDTAGTGAGIATAAGNGTTTFGFYIDQVELDLAKSFGENIRIRADLDFIPAGPGRGTTTGAVEQGYVTANIPAGNGVEFLVGRFNSGIGLDPVDRNELKTTSHNMVHRTLLPHNLTGARVAYAWSDAWSWDMAVVNDLADRAVANGAAQTAMPSLTNNLTYAWGDEGNASWVRFSIGAGPEKAAMKHWSFLGDLSASIAATEALNISAEGTYRQDDALVAGDNAQFFGGVLQGTYAFSDVWDGTFRYSYIWDLDAGQAAAATFPAATNDNFAGLTPGLGYAGQNHEVSLATGYQITDGARFGLEGRVDLATPSAAAVANGLGFGVGGSFAYNF